MPMVTSSHVSHAARQVEVDLKQQGQRIDNALATLLKGVPKSMIYRLLRTGQVRVNGKRVKPGMRLAAGDMLRIPPLRVADRSPSHDPNPNLLEQVRQAILFENKHFLVINKPSGLASHGGSGISHGVIELLRIARHESSLELAHRLDRDTSGILVLTRTRSALLGLQAAIRAGTVTKQYLCLLLGSPSSTKFDVNAPLQKYVLQGGERMVKVAAGGKPALTFFRDIESYPGAHLMQATLVTGRTHQIRVHAAHMGHPVAGDAKYGDKLVNKRLYEAGLRRLFLHASYLSFDMNGQSYAFSASLSDDLTAFLDRYKSRLD